MNKHQTLVYLKYGKLLSEINNEIKDQHIKHDMINFLVKFPLILKHPDWIYKKRFTYYVNTVIDFDVNNAFHNVGYDGNNNFQHHEISFDGKNNFQYCIHSDSDRHTLINLISINDLVHFTDIQLNDFSDITVQRIS